jgi:hypothetical protein
MAAPNVRNLVTQVSSKSEAIPLNVPGSIVTILTGGAGLKDPSGQASGYGGNLLSVFVNNSGSSSRRVKGYLVPSGETLGEKHKFFDETLGANETVLWQPRVPRKYKDSATVQFSQDVGTDVYAHAEAVEFY